ncbi:MAG: hypothetical protein H7A33_02725 [Deltaproteobacteria bacterium]|nr:hypothetical protein [Deltaproteobacteria bacterium]
MKTTLFQPKSIFLMVLIIFSANFLACDRLCPAKEVDCQVYLTKGQTSPYRDQIKAQYTGWHYAGNAGIPCCWRGFSDLCKPCSDSWEIRRRACRDLHPSYTTRAGRGIKLDQDEN